MNTRTLIAGDTTSPVILHVPHASRVIPPEIRSSLTVTDDQLAAELDEITDAHTDVIAQHAAQSVTPQPWILRNDLSRLVIDPERFQTSAKNSTPSAEARSTPELATEVSCATPTEPYEMHCSITTSIPTPPRCPTW